MLPLDKMSLAPPSDVRRAASAGSASNRPDMALRIKMSAALQGVEGSVSCSLGSPSNEGLLCVGRPSNDGLLCVGRNFIADAGKNDDSDDSVGFAAGISEATSASVA